MEASFDCNDKYRLVFLNGAQELAHLDLGPAKKPAGGLEIYKARVPAKAAAQGFTAIRIEPQEEGDNSRSVGHLTLR